VTARVPRALIGLLLVVPVAVLLRVVAPERHIAIFLASALAILPLAALIGYATEVLTLGQVR
jgi:Ca2+:H+ antiporter